MRQAQPLKTWHIVFAAIGIASIIALILNLLVISRPAKKPLTVSAMIHASDGTLLSTASRLLDAPVVTGGSIEIQENGDAFVPSLIADIDNAKQSVDFDVYIWKPGTMYDEVLGHLIMKAQQGVAVRVLIDGFGGKAMRKKDIDALRNAGANVSQYHPPVFGKLTKLHKRDHARTIVIDDQIAYTGGMAVADYWLGHAQDKDHWRDRMFRMTGPSAQHVADSFARIWEAASGEVLAAGRVPDSASGMQTMSLTSLSPDEDVEELSTLFSLSIAAADRSVIIETPYMVLEPELEKTIVATAKRGIPITIILPGEITDSKAVQTASQHYYKRLLDAGVHIYEYQPTMLHAKAMVVDGSWSVIGSANIDTRSTFYNVENIVGVQDQAFAAALEASMNADLAQSIEITPEIWKRRSIFRKLFEPAVYVFDKQL